MQTLKTAAIVVLLMTVVYGAYVSLTTPPEPLPPDVEDMLVLNDDGSFGIDAVLPPSLGELEINTGIAGDTPEIIQPADSIASNLMQPQALGASPAPSIGAQAAGAQVTGAQVTGARVTGALPSGLPPTAGTPATSASFSISDNTESINANARELATQAASNYPVTNRSFEVPDPATVQSSFDPSMGKPFTSPSTLNSGASNSDPNSVTQVSAIGVGEKAASLLDNKLADSGASLGGPKLGLANAIQTADRQYANDQRKEALATLSIFYSTPNLTGEERSELVSRLDPLAAEVIYSQRHLLETAHRVGQNETLIEIAARYEVPWQLLANINQIQDPVTILPGTELKVVRGPFRAEVDLAQSELTLFLGDLYAGRFPVGVGNDPMPRPGTFTVQDKQTSRTFYDAAGSPIQPGSPDNPYGNAWIDLGGQLCIHGSPSTMTPTDKGCISLAADYADDLYGILSQGSSVVIKR